MPRSVGMGHSGMSNWAEQDEEILLELLEQDHEEIVADYEAGRKVEHLSRYEWSCSFC